MKLGIVGAQCDVSANKIVCKQEMPLNGNYGGTSNLSLLEGEILKINAASVQDFMKNPANHFESLGEVSFKLKDTDYQGDLIFSPYNKINKGRYGIYWIFVASDKEKEIEVKAAYHPDSNEIFLEGIGVGYGAQTEGNKDAYPFLKESNSVDDPHELTRYAKQDGYFSYEIAVNPQEQNYLVCTFLKADNGKSICIKASTTSDEKEKYEIAKLTLDFAGESEKYTVKFPIDTEIVKKAKEEENKNKKHIRLYFSSGDTKDSARLCAPLKTVYQQNKE